MHPKYLIAAALLASLSSNPISAIEKMQPGCLIIQNHETDQVQLNGGYISQSFTPCESGKLEYISYFLKSASNESFSVPMSIRQDGRIIARQLIVIPVNDNMKSVRAWIAQDANLVSGKSYTLNIEIPQDRSVIASYSSENLYENGSLQLNDNDLNGDLAFEVGMRKQNELPFEVERGSCDLSQAIANGLLQFDSEIEQSITPQTSVTFSDVILQYASAESGDVLISLRANGQTMQSKVVSLVPSQDLMPLFVSFQNEIILNPGIQYDLFIQKLGVWKKDEPKIAVGKNDPYGCGELLRNGVSANIDLTFEILSNSEAPVSNNIFDAFPEHECSIAQRNFNTTKSFSGDRLVQELQFCTDGMIEGIYFAGSISSNLENVEIAITNQKGSVISQGQLLAIEGVADLLKAQFSPFQVVNVQDYWIEILVPSSETLELIGSTDSRHQITGMLLNEEPFDFAPIHAVGMKPFNFNFIEAAEEKEIEVSCFPNPFLNDFNVRVSPFEGEDLHIMVYDYMGVLMFEDWLQPSTESQTVNVMTNIPFKKGFQTVRIEHGSQVYLKTVIKQ